MGATKHSVLFCRRTVAEYLRRAKEFDTKAEKCQEPKRRGIYRYHARERRKDAIRMRANEAEQMRWLAKNNYDLWLELSNEPS